MSDIGAIDIVELFNFDRKQLGVVLALAEGGPTAVAKVVAQLDSAGGSIGQGVKMWYDAAKAELATIP